MRSFLGGRLSLSSSSHQRPPSPSPPPSPTYLSYSVGTPSSSTAQTDAEVSVAEGEAAAAATAAVIGSTTLHSSALRSRNYANSNSSNSNAVAMTTPSSAMFPTTTKSTRGSPTATVADPLGPAHSFNHRRRKMASSNFLLGGQYYPGKDRSTGHTYYRGASHQKRWWWLHRIRTRRRFAVDDIVSVPFVVRFCTALLAVAWLGGKLFGAFLFLRSSSTVADSSLWDPHEGWRLQDPTLHLPSLLFEEEAEESIRLLRHQREDKEGFTDLDVWKTHRLHLRHRWDVLEQIVPQWAHRNDRNLGHEGSSSLSARRGGGDAVTVAAKDRRPSGDEAKLLVVNAKNPSTGAGDEALVGKNSDGDYHHDAAAAVAAASRPPMITLANMDRHVGNSCPNEPNNISTSRRVQTTLVIQASPDRLWILNETCRRWTDPIVAVVGVVVVADSASSTSTSSTAATHANNSNMNVTLARLQASCPHLTLLQCVIPADPVLYPVNALRNAALDAVRTSHVLAMDADFVPSLHLDETIRRTLLLVQQQHARNQLPVQDREDDHYDAIVVPAFERIMRPPCDTSEECKGPLLHNSSFLPQTFDELQMCVREQNCQVFQHDNNWPGHYSTRSHEWLERQWYETNDQEKAANDNATTAIEVGAQRSIRQVPCFRSLRYEPYVVLEWCGTTNRPSSSNSTRRRPHAPYYDERFYGYGKNKIEHVQHLRLLGYRFMILPEGFITHNPHVDSRAKLDWNAHRSSLHSDMDRLYPAFLRELLNHTSVQNHDRRIVELCRHDE